VDVASQLGSEACRKADSHAGTTHLPPLPDHLWVRQGLRELPTCPLQKVSSSPTASYQRRKRSPRPRQGTGQGTRKSRCCWSFRTCSCSSTCQEAEAASYPSVSYWRARSGVQTNQTTRSPNMSPLSNRVQWRLQRV
jgi:hypothetical protein